MNRTAVLSAVFALALAPLAANAASLPARDDQKDWTILVFLNANNNLDSFAPLNMNQMEVAGSTDRVNVVVEVTREGADKTQRYLMQKDTDTSTVSSPVLENMPKVDMGDIASLKAFIQWGIQKYPAKHYMVDIWNHGSGWEKKSIEVARGVSYDDSTGNHITTTQLGQCLRDIAASRGSKIDVISYDACLMQMAEVCAEVADGASYQCASEETIPGAGWPYDSWLTQVVADPGADAPTVCKYLVNAYHDCYNGGAQGHMSGTLSMVDLSQIGAVSAAADDFTHALLSDASAMPKVLEAIRNTQSYAEPSHHDVQDFVDQAITSVGSDAVKTAGAALKAAVQKAVLSSEFTGDSMGKSTGFAIWIPTYTSQSLLTSYKDLAWAKGGKWTEFVTALTSNGSQAHANREETRVKNFVQLDAAAR